MKPVIDKKNEKVTIKAECRAEEGKKHVEKIEVKAHDTETVKYIERKLVDKGVGRMERHPVDGLPLKHDPKKGHGGKFTWEGPDKIEDGDVAVLDEKDPNYAEDGDEVAEEVSELVVGEVEVAKTVEEGVARIEIDPNLKVD